MIEIVEDLDKANEDKPKYAHLFLKIGGSWSTTSVCGIEVSDKKNFTPNGGDGHEKCPDCLFKDQYL